MTPTSDPKSAFFEDSQSAIRNQQSAILQHSSIGYVVGGSLKDTLSVRLKVPAQTIQPNQGLSEVGLRGYCFRSIVLKTSAPKPNPSRMLGFTLALKGKRSGYIRSTQPTQNQITILFDKMGQGVNHGR